MESQVVVCMFVLLAVINHFFPSFVCVLWKPHDTERYSLIMLASWKYRVGIHFVSWETKRVSTQPH